MMRQAVLRSMLAVVALALVSDALTAQQPLSSPTAPSSSAPPHVEATGFGERRVAPDRATVILSVTTKATSAAAAAAENARVQSRVMDTLRAMGMGSAATTASYNVGPNYEEASQPRTGPRQSGYAARTAIRVRVGDLRELGRVIDASLARGATGIDGVFFEASTQDAARREATAEAAAEARADAEALARALGGSLGPMISGTTSIAGFDPRRMMRMEAANGWVGGASTQIAPSEIVISATVLARWTFVPSR